MEAQKGEGQPFRWRNGLGREFGYRSEPDPFRDSEGDKCALSASSGPGSRLDVGDQYMVSSFKAGIIWQR